MRNVCCLIQSSDSYSGIYFQVSMDTEQDHPPNESTTFLSAIITVRWIVIKLC